MLSTRTNHVFRFQSQASLIELTGLKAQDLAELVQYLRIVPGSSIYYHTHHYLKQHQALSPEPPNDFAYWVTNVLNESHLGEQLWSIDTVAFPSLRSLREKIIETIDAYIAQGFHRREAPAGEEFHFMKSKSFVLPTPYRASTLQEFVDGLKRVSINSLYHHVFEARMRLERGNDFSNWLDAELGEKELAQAIARLDPYTQTLESLQSRMIRLIETRIQRPTSEVSYAAR